MDTENSPFIENSTTPQRSFGDFKRNLTLGNIDLSIVYNIFIVIILLYVLYVIYNTFSSKEEDSNDKSFIEEQVEKLVERQDENMT